MLIANKSFTLFFGLVMSAILFFSIRKAERRLPSVRPIEAFEAIKEAVGRATELGRPLHFATGMAPLTGETAPETLAGLRILSDTSRLCAEYESELINTVMIPLVLPISQEIVRQGYISAGKSDLYNPDMVRFISPMQFSYAAGVMELMRSEKIAANIQIGRFAAEALLLAETAARVGAIQIGGTVNMYQLQYFVVACDYVLIGEEMFAADAYLSQEPVSLGCLQGQDYIKLVSIFAILIGSVLKTMNINLVIEILSKYGN